MDGRLGSIGHELKKASRPKALRALPAITVNGTARMRPTMPKSDKRINKAIDAGDYDELQKAMAKSDAEASDAVTS